MPEIPEAITTRQEDGSVVVQVGNLRGLVTSEHLVEPKIKQLQQAWLTQLKGELDR